MPSPTWASAAAAAAAAAAAEGPTGFHLFEIVGYSRAKDVPTGTSLRSCPFMIGGYRWVIEVFMNGQIPEDADFIGVSFALMQDVEQPVKVHAAFSFIDEVEKQDPRYVRSSPFNSCA